MKNLLYKVFFNSLAVILFHFGPPTMPCNGQETGLKKADMDTGYELYDRVLQNYVKDGKVAYLALRDSPEELDKYLSWLAHTKPNKLETAEESLAFWINAYNAFVLKGVLDTLPEKTEDISSYSVKRTRAFFTIEKFVVGGSYYSLDEIENNILRPIFKDPRVHFSIVCASQSCPVLQGKAFRGGDIHKRLEEATKRFLSNKNRFKIDRENKIVYLSRIFRWFEEDFEGAKGSLYDFIADYLESEEDRAFIKKGNFTIKYLDYDWSLNIKP
ncbi:MAG: DUF547 domain-containing protein [Candidatus Brocadiales bacterium]